MGCRFARFGEEKMSQGQSDAELRLVTPGMAIGPSAGKRIGSGAVAHDDDIIATKLGWVREFNGTVSVDPINSSYIPRSGDLIVATVAEVRNNLWFMNINGAFQGLLPMSLAPWKVEFGAARQHMGIGDVALARVQEVDECHNVVLTMKGIGLRRLNQGALLTIPVNHIDRIKGKDNSTLERLKSASDCRIIVGQNGKVWVDGDAQGIAWSRAAIEIAQRCGHKETFEAELSAHENNAPNRGEQ